MTKSATTYIRICHDPETCTGLNLLAYKLAQRLGKSCLETDLKRHLLKSSHIILQHECQNMFEVTQELTTEILYIKRHLGLWWPFNKFTLTSNLDLFPRTAVTAA